MGNVQEPASPALTLLVSRLKPVVTKRAGLALALWGEAGIGKTHAVQGLLAAATCRGFSLHAAVPLVNLTKALPRPSRLPLWALRPLEGLARGEHSEGSASADALAALLAALAPVVLHLEDLHEAAPERQELWGALAERVKRSRGVALLATSRTCPPEAFEAWRVEPLSEASSAALLAVKVGTMLPQEANAWIYKRAQGNPLFTLEYLRYLSRQGYLWNDLRHWRWREPPQGFVPVTVEALIERTVEQAGLSEASREALEAAAMVPVDTPLELWQALAALPEDALRRAEAELERCGFFKGGRFVHPLFREVTLHSLSPLRRRELSRRALAALEDDPQTAASFVEEAGLEPEAALDLIKRAAERAAERSNVEAARFLAKAVAYAKGDEKGRLAFEAAQTLSHVSVVEAERLLEVAANDPTLRAEVLFLLAELLAAEGRRADAERVLDRLSLAERTGPRWISRLIQIHSAANNDAGVLELFGAHPEVMEGDALTVSRVVRALAHDGRLGEGEAFVRHRLSDPTLESKDRLVLLKAFSVIAYMRADFSKMERLEAEIYGLARPLGDLRLMDAALFNRAIALGNLGRYPEQKACLEGSLELCRELGDQSAYVIAQTAYADTLIDAADYEGAETLLREAHAVLQRLDLSAYLVGCEASLARLYDSWRPPHGKLLALKHAQASLQEARKRNTTSLLVEGLCALARAEAWGGSAARAESLALEALERTRHVEMPAARLNALDARARSLLALGKPELAKEVFAEALVMAQSLGGEAAIRFVALELDRLDNDVEGAGEHMRWFKAQGLMNGVNLARRYFPELTQGEMASPAASDASRLELLGPMQVVHNGVPQSVRGQKRKELLASLLEAKIAGRAEVSQLELLDSLYPGEPEDAAADALKQLVFQLRKSLGAGTILRTTGGYALGNVTSDAEDFFKKADTRLWRGVYREDAGEGDETVSSALYHALRMKAADLLKAEPLEAARLGRLLLQADPYDVASLRLTIKALQATGDHRTLTKLYQEGRIHLAEVGERLPGHWAEFLRQQAA